MSKGKVTVNLSPGWLGLLGVTFVVTKIFEIGPIAAWSWWLVLLPFYFWIAVLFGVAALSAVGVTGLFGIAAVADWFNERKYRKIRARLAAEDEKARAERAAKFANRDK